MADTYFDECLAAESALVRYLKTKVASFTDADGTVWCLESKVFAGIENIETQANEGQESSLRKLPCIMVKSEIATPQTHDDSVWIPHVDVAVMSNRNQTTRDMHRRRAQQVFREILVQDIENLLCSSDFFVLKIKATETGHSSDDHVWMSYREFDFYGCAAADLR